VSGLKLYVEGFDPMERFSSTCQSYHFACGLDIATYHPAALAVEYISSTGSNYNPDWRSSVVELQWVDCAKMMGEGKKESDTGGPFERVLNGDPRLWNGVAGRRQSLTLIGELVCCERGTLSIVWERVSEKSELA
jgi:hypothetical protein